MGWGCTIKDKDGRNLLEKYGIQYQFLGLGPNSDEHTEAPFSVTRLRRILDSYPYKEEYPRAAKDAVAAVQKALRENLESLKPPQHCETCTCFSEEEEPEGWSRERIENFLRIDLDEVHYVNSSS